MNIGTKKIGNSSPSFIIAEAGVNYNNNLSIALKMVDVAVKSGADAIKFQTFVTDQIQLKNSSKPSYQSKIKGKSYYKIIKSLEPKFDDQIKIAKYCKKRGIIFLSTPYDKTSLDFLDKLGMPAFKIASTDLTNHILLKYVAKKRKPIFLSTGLADLKQVEQSFNLLKKYGMKNKLVLVLTTSDYPTKNEDVNLKVISDYIKRFNVLVGFSDHTKDNVASLGAIALGACVIEKHFTLNKTLPGPDQSSSLEPLELQEWIKSIRIMEKSLGNSKKIVTSSERKNLSMRKVIVLKPAKKGTRITNDHILAMRGNKKGILPTDQNIKKILGRRFSKNLLEPTQFSWNMVT